MSSLFLFTFLLCGKKDSNLLWCATMNIYQFSRLKVAFFQKERIRFSNLQSKNIPNYYPELEIWICCLHLLSGNLNFKFRIVFWNIFFGNFKNTSHFLKKATFNHPMEKKQRILNFHAFFLTINDILGGRRQKTNNEIILKLALFTWPKSSWIIFDFVI